MSKRDVFEAAFYHGSGLYSYRGKFATPYRHATSRIFWLVSVTEPEISEAIRVVAHSAKEAAVIAIVRYIDDKEAAEQVDGERKKEKNKRARSRKEKKRATA